MEFVFLGGLALLGSFYLTKDFNQTGIKTDSETEFGDGRSLTPDVTTYKNPKPKERRNMMDFSEMGFTYSVAKANTFNLVNLNEAYKPWSAPTQKSTMDIVDIFEDQAKNLAHLEAFSTPFYFTNRQGSIPLGTNQNTNPQVAIPTKASIKGDRNRSLANYPRVYIQSGEEIKKLTAEPCDGFLDAGMPEEENKKYVPLTGKLNRDWNPWGNGGHLQRIFNKRQETTTERKKANRSILMGPVYGHRIKDL